MPSNLRCRMVMRYDHYARIFRLARIMWETRRPVGDGVGYSAKLTIGLRPALWVWGRETSGWLITIAGVRLHLRRSYGGIFS